MKARDLEVEPRLATGHGALGFWKAMRQVWDTTKEQRCWVLESANVLDKATNPIESVFSTVRLRHRETKGGCSRLACLTTVYKLMESASTILHLLNGSTLLPEVVQGTVFVDCVKRKPAA